MSDHGLVLISMVALFVQGLIMLRQRQRNEDLCARLFALASENETYRRHAEEAEEQMWEANQAALSMSAHLLYCTCGGDEVDDEDEDYDDWDEEEDL